MNVCITDSGKSGWRKTWADFFGEFFYYVRLGTVALLLNLVWLLPVVRDMLTHHLGTYFNNFLPIVKGMPAYFFRWPFSTRSTCFRSF